MTSRPNHDHGEGGFLLAEMLTTLTISAFALAGLVVLTSIFLRSVDRSVARIETTDDLGRTLAVLRRDIETAARARFAGAEPQPFLFNGDGSRVMFAHTTPRPERAIQVVALKSDTSGRLLQADASLSATAGALSDLHFGKPRVIYAGPARIRFSYFAASSSGAPEQHLAIWPVGASMPMAMTIEAVDASTGRVLVTLRTTLRANTDLGCLDDSFCGRADHPPKSATGVSPPTSASNVGAL